MSDHPRDERGSSGVPLPPKSGDFVRFFAEQIETHGTTPGGVDWNSTSAQELRFSQLLRVCDLTRPFSIIDYGCGYGALARYLADRVDSFTYQGFDLTPAMVAEARKFLADLPSVSVTTDATELVTADYTVASGLFSMKFDTPVDEWERHVLRTIDHLAALSKRGFAFNSLTSYSDAPLMRSNLYYADPCFYFDHCKRHYSRNVALLHDYDLFDFTIIVRLEEDEARDA
jgi:SAM-dependent methyltransferase